VSEVGTRKDKVRGIDRNSGDLTPKNLTKKLKQTKKKAAPAAGMPNKAAPASGPVGGIRVRTIGWPGAW